MNTQSIQNKIFDAISTKYSDAVAKKINSDNYLDLVIPSLFKGKKDCLFFNTKNEAGIKIGFTCNDKAVIDALIALDKNVVTFSGGIKLSIDTNGADQSVKSALHILSLIDQVYGNNISAESPLNTPISDEQKNKKIEIEVRESPQVAIVEIKGYTGEISAGRKHGKGKYTDEDGNIFDGTWDQDLFLKGTKITPEKDIEKGDFKDGNLNGKGKRYWKNGILWEEGDFKDGKLNGKGKCYQKNGTLWQEGDFKDGTLRKTYYQNGKLWEEGDFKDGKLNGKGKYYRENGTLLYEGDFVDDKYNGKGKTYYQNGTLSREGDFKDDELNGKGKCYWENGTLSIEGDFKDGNLNGKGKYYYENGTLCYEGDFVENKYNGKGKWYKENGTLWQEGDFKDGTLRKTYYQNGNLWKEGDFKDRELDGKGKWYRENGTLREEGDFKDGNLNGKGKSYHKNGTLFQEGDFRDGDLNGKGKYYRENGKLWEEGDFKDGKLNGKGKRYYENGTLREEGDFVDGSFTGSGKITKVAQQQEEVKRPKEQERENAKNDKHKKKSFKIVYSIKMKQEESIDFGIVGKFFGTPKAITAKKGGHYERSLIMRNIYDTPTKAEALHFICTNDSDVKKGKAGSSTIHIIKIELY